MLTCLLLLLLLPFCILSFSHSAVLSLRPPPPPPWVPQAVLSHLRQDPVVAFVADPKTEEIGPGVFRFKVRLG